MSDRVALEDLNALLNSWPEGTRGHEADRLAIETMDELGVLLGYGWLEQLAHWLYLVQIHRSTDEAARNKTARFRAMDWPLPLHFEEALRRVKPL